LGVIGMSVYLRQRQATQSKPQALSDEDRRKVQEILKSGDES
jgi:cytochrome c-type biogenesis protein CcmH/NrfF